MEGVPVLLLARPAQTLVGFVGPGGELSRIELYGQESQVWRAAAALPRHALPRSLRSALLNSMHCNLPPCCSVLCCSSLCFPPQPALVALCPPLSPPLSELAAPSAQSFIMLACSAMYTALLRRSMSAGRCCCCARPWIACGTSFIAHAATVRPLHGGTCLLQHASAQHLKCVTSSDLQICCPY